MPMAQHHWLGDYQSTCTLKKLDDLTVEAQEHGKAHDSAYNYWLISSSEESLVKYKDLGATPVFYRRAKYWLF